MLRKIYFLPWGGLGDVLLATPTLSALAKANPQAQIFCPGKPHLRDLLGYNPCVHQFVSSPEEALSAPPEQFRNITNQFDGTEAIFHPYYGKLQPSICEHPQHAIKMIGGMAGIIPTEARVQIHLGPEDEEKAERLTRKIGRPFVALHPTGICSKGKEWYPERWAEVVRRLIGEGYKVVQLGHVFDQPIPGCVSLLGRATLRVSFALLKRAAAFIGIESLYNHVGAALGIPSVVLFGASTPLVWGYEGNINLYRGLACQPCIDMSPNSCPPRHCMQRITVDEVIQSLKKLLCY